MLRWQTDVDHNAHYTPYLLLCFSEGRWILKPMSCYVAFQPGWALRSLQGLQHHHTVTLQAQRGWHEVRGSMLSESPGCCCLPAQSVPASHKQEQTAKAAKFLHQCMKHTFTSKWIRAQQKASSPASAKPWVQFLARCKPGMVAQGYNASTWEVEEKDQKFKITLGYKASLGLAWTAWDPIPKTNNIIPAMPVHR